MTRFGGLARLVGAETNRLLSRRFTVVTLLVVLLGLGLFQLVVNDALKPPTEAEIAANRAQFNEVRAEWEANHAQWEAECVASGVPERECAIPPPTEADFGLAAVPFEVIAADSLQLAVYLSALALFLVAASFVGAEFSTGAIANWLTFVPQRGRVFAAKLVTVTGCGLVVGAAGAGFAVGMAVLLTRIHGGPLEGWSELLQTAGRSLAVATALAIAGFCMGVVTRHTAAAIGVLLGYLFVWFVRAAILSQFGWAQRLTRWAPEANLAAILDDGYRYAVPVQRLTPGGVQLDYVERSVTLGHGVVYWLALIAVLVAGSLLIFRRRDVT